MRKIFLLPILMLTLAVQAQENYVYFNWDINVPTSNTSWLSSTSVAGAKVGYRKFFQDRRFSAGVDFNWTTFDQYEPAASFVDGTTTVTTDYFKYIYQYAFTANVQYYFTTKEDQIFFPYAGLGLGAMHNKYMLYYNIYSEGNESWGFLARPEVGAVVRIPGRRYLGVMGAVHFDISTNKSPEYNYKGFSAIGFQLGLVMMSRY